MKIYLGIRKKYNNETVSDHWSSVKSFNQISIQYKKIPYF